MEKVLKLERRGCNFWHWCQERKDSDLENFRLCGEVESDKNYFIEIITTNTTDKHFIRRNKMYYGLGATFTTIDNQYDRYTEKTAKDGTKYTLKEHFRDMSKFITPCAPTMKAVLEAINKAFGTDYTRIEILPDGESLNI